MVYRNSFVAVVTCHEKILRESRSGQEDVIRIPFGEEYALRLKNLSNLRAVVDVSVDGVDALSGSRLVIESNGTHDLEGFMENGTVRNRFKFIKKTEQIAEYRGDFIEDGIIQVKYQFEKEPEQPIFICNPLRSHTNHWYNDWPNYYGDLKYGSCVGGGTSCSTQGIMSNYSNNLDSPISEEGITVKGSQTNINYNTTYLRELYPEINTIVFKLVGETSRNTRIIRPITTRSQLVCPTCGTRNTSRNKYCANCGTCLI